jgi:ankyrin repeat protein
MLLGHLSPHADLRDYAGRTALWHAVRRGNEDIIQLFLDNGAGRSDKHVSSSAQPLLCLAASSGRCGMV